MEYKDYYKILGVDKNASEDAIKRAYRKLAMQYHPDRNPGNKKYEERFKEINEAYQVLSDPQKRSRYDQLGESYTRWQQRGGAPGGFNWDQWFTQPGGGSVRVNVGHLDDLFGEGSFSEFFSRIFGGMGGATPGFGDLREATRPPRLSQHQAVTISLDEAYHGTTRRIEVDGRRLEVKIPPGANSDTKVRVAQALHYPDGQKGDLYLDIQVAPDARFERKGSDLHTHVEIDLFTAVLGGEVRVPTLSGEVMLTIPPGTQPEQTFRLAGKGMPRLKQPDTFGDLLVRAKVKLPRKLSAAQKKLFEELARTK